MAGHSKWRNGLDCKSAEVTSRSTLTVPLFSSVAVAATHKLGDDLEGDSVKELYSLAEFSE